MSTTIERNPNQNDKVLLHLQNNGSLSRNEALEMYAIKDLSACVSALRKRGVCIFAEKNPEDPSNTIYILPSEEQQRKEERRRMYLAKDHPRLYTIWHHMRQRCNYPRHKSYEYYGGKGVKVCDEWDRSFNDFAMWAYANGYRVDAEYMECTIDRINNDGDYEPHNCRWVSIKRQCNNRSNNVVYEINGKAQTLAEWSVEVGIASDTIQRRIKLGWSLERAISTPVRKQKNNRIFN